MTRRVGKLWPLLLSLVGHAVALAALAYFFVRAGPAGRPVLLPQIGLEEPRLRPSALDDVTSDPSRDVRFAGALSREPRLPDPPRQEAPPPPDDDEPFLPPLEADDPAWVVIDIPLSVARRRIERAADPARAAPPPSEASPPAPAPPAVPPQPSRGASSRPPPLKPVHAPQYYPREAIEQRLEGRVLVEVTVHTSGTVMGTRLLESSGHDVLDRAALASARQWRFARIPRTRKAAIPFRFTP